MHGVVNTSKEQTNVYRFKSTCGHCGGTFWAQSDRARWCSQACKQKAYRARKERKAGEAMPA